MVQLPTVFVPHGGGPCFFMEWTASPKNPWDKMADFLRTLTKGLPERPRALLVISGHWEEAVPTVTTSKAPTLLYDYYGFPPHTYELKWPAPAAPAVADRVRELLGLGGIASGADGQRGFDHGVFVPLKLTYPEADVPTVALSLKANLSPSEHLAIGRALAPLRSEGVLIIGSGMSYHNMRGFMTQGALAPSARFDQWLTEACTSDAITRDQKLSSWTLAPNARDCHPREEHLLPLMVVAGAAGADTGKAIFRDIVLNSTVSAFAFGNFSLSNVRTEL